MIDIRCMKCKRLLMKAEFVKGQIKCPKCGYIQPIIKAEEIIKMMRQLPAR
jgi:phage FluMu protein Com